MPAISKEQTREAATGLVNFINESPSPYHVVHNAKTKLINAGFKELSEKVKWELVKGGRYFMTRNGSTLIAFIVGKKYQAGNGVTLVGTHTDSPCLRLKPNSKKFKSGYLSVGVQCYGGGLWNTWFDRDLKVAGRVMIKKDGKLEHHLVHINEPILRIPMLCVHLQREINQEGFKPNTETQMVPIIATKVFEDELNKLAHVSVYDDESITQVSVGDATLAEISTNFDTMSETLENEEETNNSFDSEASKHHTILVKLICEKVGCHPLDLVNMELCLADTQPSVIGGVYKEFIFSPRLDNQFNSYCAITSIIESSKEGVETEPNIRMINCFDNEEVGSGSAQGAKSMLPELVIRRICQSFGGAFEQCIANSFLVSADQTFAVNPNYVEKYEENHMPALHKGVVMNINANQRFATTAITASVIREIGKRCAVPIQDFVVRNDSACGTTIGPIQAQKLGIRTVDVGGPMLSMHSCRETCAITTVRRMIVLMTSFFRLFPKIDAEMKTD